MSANVAVIIERKTRMVRLIKNNSKHSDLIVKSLFGRIIHIPKKHLKSITFDNGKEFAKHSLFSAIGMKVYFCDPYSPWQKGQVERVNRSIRRFIPKPLPY